MSIFIMMVRRFCLLFCLYAVLLGHAQLAWSSGSCEGGDDKISLLGVSLKKGVVVFTGSTTQCETVCESDGCDGKTVTRQVTLFHDFSGHLRPPGLSIHGWAEEGNTAERNPEWISKQVAKRHAGRLETERRTLNDLGSLIKLEPATANHPITSPNGACQASIDFSSVQIPKGQFRFIGVTASVRSNNAVLLERKLAKHNTQGGSTIGYALFDVERRALVLILLYHQCLGPPPGMFGSDGECEDHAHTMVLSVPAVKERKLAICFDSPTPLRALPPPTSQ